MKKGYVGIDYFRFFAALLIIAIHTSPLASVSETGDFIFTRIAARVAVPFFFMTSGFFLISRYTYNNGKLLWFVKKTAIVYVVSIIIYIPVCIYTGYFHMKNLLPNLIKDIVFDGTFYHLWYLPASIIGAVIAWYLVKKLDYKKGMIVAGVLYVIGLFGDSYYGLAGQVTGLHNFYELLFQVSEYTRNGVFFAPVFFMTGGFISDYLGQAAARKVRGMRRGRTDLRKYICGFAVSFALMFTEAMLLHYFNVQRHDSMYVFLPLCMYFLFCSLLQFTGKRKETVRTASLVIYLIHPMVIIVVRLAAKLLPLQELLVDNSIVHYIIVSVVSVAAGILVTVLWDKFKPRKVKPDVADGRAYVEINLAHLAHNARVLQKAMPSGCRLMAVVKAEAYGHGSFETATHLEKAGVRAFAVATADEGIRLRKYGIRGEILVLGYTDVRRASELKKYRLTQTVIDYAYAKALARQRTAVNVHIKIDTGMHRLGIDSREYSRIKKVFEMESIHVTGMFTHLCCAESRQLDDVAFTREQIDRFYRLAEMLEGNGIKLPKLHIQSSYGLLNYPELPCDYVRVGIALYGVYSAPEDETVLDPDLRPVLSLKSRIVLIRPVMKGSSVGYDRMFIAERDSRIAILPVGYADGIPRVLSGHRGAVMIRGQYAPVVGRICMDQLAVDVTDLEMVSVGDEAVLVSAEPKSGLTAPDVAGYAGSISNELLSRMGARLPVVVK